MINPRNFELNDGWHLSLLRDGDGWIASATCPNDATVIQADVPETTMLALEPVSFPDTLFVCPTCSVQGRVVDGAWVNEP